jgi:hypothetical protein
VLLVKATWMKTLKIGSKLACRWETSLSIDSFVS